MTETSAKVIRLSDVGFSVHRYSHSLTTSVSQTLRDMSVCVYTLQNESAGIDVNTSESRWVC